MTEGPQEDRSASAAEYVIGLSSRLEREAAARQMQQDAGFAAQVEWWTMKLAALNSEFAPVTPPARIKKRIDERLFGKKRRAWFPWFFSGVGAAALMVMLVVAVLPLLDQPDLRAELLGDETTFQVAVGAELTITRLAGELAPGRVYELWLILDGNTPQSLGTFDDNAILDAGMLEAGATLAVSLEPVGGSPTGAPTGPVLAVGVLEDA